MSRLSFAVACAAIAMGGTPVAAATYLDAGIAGTVTTSIPTPVPGEQTFTLSGGFTSYDASSDLPQISGGDLSAYTFSVSGTSIAYDDATHTATYGDVTGTINGYGQVVQTLAPTTLTVTFDPTFATATVLGTLMSTGATTPVGFPGPIDFSPANGATITGTYVSNGTSGGGGNFTGAITFPPAAGAVPEAATWAMMIAGMGLVGVGMRRRSGRPIQAV